MKGGETYFILSGRRGNLRRCKANLRNLEEWEFAQSIIYLDGMPTLFMITVHKKDRLVIKTATGNYLLWVSSIPLSDTYSSLFQVINAETNETCWLYDLKVLKLDIFKEKKVDINDIEFN